jgi:hypothetical protein
VEVLRGEPQLLALLLGRLGVRLPPGAIPDVKDSDLSSRDPDLIKILLADNVFVFQGLGKRLAVVFEVQASRPDPSRKLAWPAYLTVARAIHGCDAILCVIGLSAAAVRDSRKTIRTGHPGFELTPRVTGHGLMPILDTPALGPGLTVLNVMTRDLDLASHDARMLVLTILAYAPPEQRDLYTRYIRAVVPQRVRKALEELMKTVIKDPFMDGLIDRGKAIEAASMLLRYLEARWDVPESIRQRVTDCTETAQLEAWFDSAIPAKSLDEVFNHG